MGVVVVVVVVWGYHICSNRTKPKSLPRLSHRIALSQPHSVLQQNINLTKKPTTGLAQAAGASTFPFSD